MNWEVDYYLQKYPNSRSSDLLFLVSQDQVPIIVTLYTVALQRNTRFAYMSQSAGFFPSSKPGELGLLPSLFKSKGEPYRSMAIQKYKDEYYAAAAADFKLAWDNAGDKCVQALCLLSTCYDYVDRLAYSKALEVLDTLTQDENCIMRLCDVAGSGAPKQLSRLREFLLIAGEHFGGERTRDELKVFADRRAVEVFIRSLYASALRRIKQHEPEQAVLLLYRIVEVVAQNLLAQHNIDTAYFDTASLTQPLREKFLAAMSRLSGQEEIALNHSFNKVRLGCFESWILYLVCFLDNDSFEEAERFKFLGGLRNKLELRNRCFLEHGVTGVSGRQAAEFVEWVKHAIVKQFASMTLPDLNQDADLKSIAITMN
ncbi:MAG: hypothetical protein JRN52_02005 [Nitrososphaerota archaeon]|nr:hypothetical protein [Nitrososphaerota archaeon]